MATPRHHLWLGNLVSNPNETVEAIASREGKTERSIRKLPVDGQTPNRNTTPRCPRCVHY